MPEPVVDVHDLVKVFRSPERETGTKATIAALFRAQHREIRAIDGLTFSIDPGEIVGFLGENGAGKTVTLKCLAGLLHPTSGSIRVLGHVPHVRDRAMLRQLTMMAGHRNQLLWDLPAQDTFEVHKTIYEIPDSRYSETLDELVELLELGPLLRQSVRRMSLGQRMRCELAAALLHRPRLVLLDEPTIGLDATVQYAIREFLKDYCRRHESTILLSSHYMADLSEITSRVLLLDHGTLRYDGTLTDLVRRAAPYVYLKMVLRHPADPDALKELGDLEHHEGLHVTMRVPRAESAGRAGAALRQFDVQEVTVQEPATERIMVELFASGQASDA
ncbi:ABC transporter ATP-binding protein [Catelliglobosispora koreensis]|uniref:ABC transporter ATP-binding protein n=1 Tax=Catelliglobosispora koreensis TaxID=129052 RepID=UPI000360DE26|nr:ATP-binding cassette domain-containing protein [Catelliglobosispora koreensis]